MTVEVIVTRIIVPVHPILIVYVRAACASKRELFVYRRCLRVKVSGGSIVFFTMPMKAVGVKKGKKAAAPAPPMKSMKAIKAVKGDQTAAT